jgi:hypothetical protein
MATMFQDTRAELLLRDAELQQLSQEHSRYEAQLEQLRDTPYVSAEALLLEANLKKLKLRVKDEMERRVAQLFRGLEVH